MAEAKSLKNESSVRYVSVKRFHLAEALRERAQRSGTNPGQLHVRRQSISRQITCPMVIKAQNVNWVLAKQNVGRRDDAFLSQIAY